jgi:hypothetical protein
LRQIAAFLTKNAPFAPPTPKRAQNPCAAPLWTTAQPGPRLGACAFGRFMDYDWTRN